MTGYPRIGLAIRTSLLCHSEERSDEESERSDEEILRPQNGSSVCSARNGRSGGALSGPLPVFQTPLPRAAGEGPIRGIVYYLSAL